MGTNIKTGKELWEEINEYSDSHGEHDLNRKKFVSVEWLKEQIEKKQKRINLSGDNKFKAIYNNALDWMFMLLREE